MRAEPWHCPSSVTKGTLGAAPAHGSEAAPRKFLPSPTWIFSPKLSVMTQNLPSLPWCPVAAYSQHLPAAPSSKRLWHPGPGFVLPHPVPSMPLPRVPRAAHTFGKNTSLKNFLYNSSQVCSPLPWGRELKLSFQDTVSLDEA